jgi:hypothetical protein
VGDARRVMQNLYQDGFVRQSLQLGEALAEGGAASDYTFYLDVADLAGELGDDTARDRWTIRAFEGIDFGFRILDRVPFPTLHRIVSDVVAMDAPQWPRDEAAARVYEKLCDAVTLTELEQAEASLWISLAIGQPERALQELEGLAGFHPGVRPSHFPASLSVAVPGSGEADSGWDRIENLLILVGDRLPFREPLDRMAGILIDRMRPPSGVGSEEATRRFAEVRIRHLLWTLENANRPVRQRLIQEFLAMACGEELHFDLALGLEKQGMAAEALPVYAELLRKDSTSIEAAV